MFFISNLELEDMNAGFFTFRDKILLCCLGLSPTPMASMGVVAGFLDLKRSFVEPKFEYILLILGRGLMARTTFSG